MPQAANEIAPLALEFDTLRTHAPAPKAQVVN
jgi:hypothetical protein